MLLATEPGRCQELVFFGVVVICAHKKKYISAHARNQPGTQNCSFAYQKVSHVWDYSQMQQIGVVCRTDDSWVLITDSERKRKVTKWKKLVYWTEHLVLEVFGTNTLQVPTATVHWCLFESMNHSFVCTKTKKKTSPMPAGLCSLPLCSCSRWRVDFKTCYMQSVPLFIHTCWECMFVLFIVSSLFLQCCHFHLHLDVEA